MLTVDIFSAAGNRPDEEADLIMCAARAAFDLVSFPFDAQIDVTLTDDEGIRQINRDERGIDRATDVLSFPMLDFDEGEYRGAPEVDRDPDSGVFFLGDVLISLERARAQAEEYGHSVERECAYLMVHSVLHLLGFDHMDEAEQKAAMRAQEEKALAAIGLERKE